MDIENKTALIEKMRRNDFYLPSGPFCSLTYMFGVLNKQFYCPTYTNVRLRPCPTPPPKKELLEEVNLALTATGNLPLGDMTKYEPNVSWLLTILSTLIPRHHFFLKSYKAPPRKTKKTIAKP